MHNNKSRDTEVYQRMVEAVLSPKSDINRPFQDHKLLKELQKHIPEQEINSANKEDLRRNVVFKYIALTSTTALKNGLGSVKIMTAMEMFKGSIV